MMKLYIAGYVIVLFICFIQITHAEWLDLENRVDLMDNTHSAFKIHILKSDTKSTLILFKLFGFEKNEIQINNINYASIYIPGMNFTTKKGWPLVPKISKSILIPTYAKNIKTRVLNITQTKLQLNRILIPSKGILMRNDDPNKIPYMLSKFYKSKDIFPLKVFKLNNKKFKIRKAKGLTITFYPIQYEADTQTIKVTEELLLEILYDVSDDVLKISNKDLFNQEFSTQIYKNHFINFKQIQQSLSNNLNNKFVQEGSKILFIAPKKFIKTLLPLVWWKQEKGFEVILTSLSKIGMSYFDIKKYIKKQYETNRISYVVLVGDENHIPYHPGQSGNVINKAADPLYSLMDDDYYPDLFVSRLTVKTQEELRYLIYKIISYERAPYHIGDWYYKAIGIASNESDNGPTDAQRMDILRQKLLSSSYKQVDKFYDPDIDHERLIESINRGSSLINYIGHGEYDRWISGNFTNENIMNLNNGLKLPVIISVACMNGAFDYTKESFAETWLKAGSIYNPKGAIAVFASSTYQAWDPPIIGQSTIIQLLIDKKATTLGGLFMNGVMAVLDDAEDDEEFNKIIAKQTFESWHIFGDASLEIRTTQPESIKITRLPPKSISIYTRGVYVQTESNIRISIINQNKELIGSGKTLNSENVFIEFKNPIKRGDTLTLSFTGLNKYTTYYKINVY